MVTNYPPKAFAKCEGPKCNHHQIWEVNKVKVPKKYDCPECGWLNILEAAPEVSYCPGVTTKIKVLTSMDPRFDD